MVKPSALYFESRGGGVPASRIEDYRLALRAGELERQILAHIAGIIGSPSAFRPGMLWDATYDARLIGSLCEKGNGLANLSREDRELCLSSIREKAGALQIADARHRGRRRGIAILTALAGLTIVGYALRPQPMDNDAFLQTFLGKVEAKSTRTADNDTFLRAILEDLANEDATITAQPGREAPAPSMTAQPSSLLLLGDERAPNTLDAWLSFSCTNCATAWTNFRDNMEEILEPGQASLRLHIIPPSEPTFLTLTYYYEALLAQDPSLAKEFVTWVFSNQGTLATGGIQDGGLQWLQGRMDFTLFKDAVLSDRIRFALEANADQARALSLPGTPTLLVNGSPLAGSDIQPDKIKGLLKAPRGGGDHE